MLAVSKFHPREKIAELLEAGQQLFGENYVQEAKGKYQSFLHSGGVQPLFHCIGHLQRNKSKDAARIFDCIQTVDRIELATELDSQAGKIGNTLKILLQVKVSSEETKSGCAPEQLSGLFRSCRELSNLQVQGLMCIGRFSDEGVSEEERRKEFQLLRALRDSLEEEYSVRLPELSMGMSEDFEIAVEEGATIVRVGTAVFGERPKPQANMENETP